MVDLVFLVFRLNTVRYYNGGREGVWFEVTSDADLPFFWYPEAILVSFLPISPKVGDFGAWEELSCPTAAVIWNVDVYRSAKSMKSGERWSALGDKGKRCCTIE